MASGFWLRTHGSDTHGSINTAVNTRVLDNAGSSMEENRRLTVLGYYLTLFSSTSNLYALRVLAPVPEMIATGDLTFQIPEDDDALLWAKHYAHAGTPAYFQIKSKRTLQPDDHMWVQTFALNAADNIHWSLQAYIVGN